MAPKKESAEEKEIFASQGIKDIIASITEEYGEGVITTLGHNKLKGQKVLSTGSLFLDQVIGGGYRWGTIVEIYGQVGTGKSTLALQAVRECQKLGKTAAYVDVENALNRDYAKEIGVKIGELLLISPHSGEEALSLVVKLVGKGVNLIIIDSVAALVPKAELEADLEKQIIGLQARMMSAGLRNTNHALNNKECIIIFINQLRNSINTGSFFVNPETTTGGRALSYFASLRISLRIKKKIEKNDKFIGIETQTEITKNRLVSPYRKILLEIIFGKGTQKEREIFDLAVELNIIQKSGNWYSYGENKLGNGKENVADYLQENPDLYAEIEKNMVERIINKKEEE